MGMWYNYTSDYPDNVTVSLEGTTIFDNDNELSTENISNLSGINDLLTYDYDNNCSLNLSVSSEGGEIRVCLTNSTFYNQYDMDLNTSPGIPYFYFFPPHRSAKNVSAWKQNDTLGAINISNNGTMTGDLVIWLNESLTNITLRASNISSNISTMDLTTERQIFLHNISASSAHMMWFWADYFNPSSLPRSYDIYFTLYTHDD